MLSTACFQRRERRPEGEDTGAQRPPRPPQGRIPRVCSAVHTHPPSGPPSPAQPSPLRPHPHSALSADKLPIRRFFSKSIQLSSTDGRLPVPAGIPHDFLSYRLLGVQGARGTEDSVLAYVHDWGHYWQSLTEPERSILQASINSFQYSSLRNSVS